MSEQETKVAEPTVEAKAEPKAEVTPTLTPEDINQILGEKEKRIVDLESQLKGIRKLQSEADKEVKRLREQPQPSNTQAMRELITALESQQEKPDEYGNVRPSPQLAKMKATVARMELQERQQQAFRQIESEVQKIKREAEEAGIDPEGEEFDTIVNAFKMHDIPEAKRRADRLMKKHQGVKEQKVEKTGKPEEETRAEIEKEVRAEFLKKYKIQDIGSPGGGSLKPGDIIAKYAKGEATRAEYERAIGKKSE